MWRRNYKAKMPSAAATSLLFETKITTPQEFPRILAGSVPVGGESTTNSVKDLSAGNEATSVCGKRGIFCGNPGRKCGIVADGGRVRQIRVAGFKPVSP